MTVEFKGIIGKVVESKSEHLVLALLAIPPAMVIFAALLSRLNVAYLRFQGVEPTADDDENEKWFPRIRSPLDRIITVSAFIAVGVVFAYMTVGPHHIAAPYG